MNSRRYTAAFAAALLVTALGWAVSANADDVNRAMLDFAFSRAQTQFYKPTSDQALLDGAVSGMRLAVAAKHGDPSKLPALRS
ncbi:MAG: hypothetical protein ACHQY2_06250, partial [Candidatus Eremiobacterales bacterium]